MKNSFKDPSYKVITLNKSAGGKAIFFIPGGPGMSPECFKEFAQRNLKDFTVRGIQYTGEGKASMRAWTSSLKKALKENPSDLVIGHSFGGMILLSTPGIEKLTNAQIILSSSPDLRWRKNLLNIDISPTEERQMAEASRQFKNKPSLRFLKSMWQSWAPYYFSKDKIKKGGRWLREQKYILKASQVSDKLLKGYRMKELALVPTMFLSGQQDLLTPLSDFKIKKLIAMPNVSFKEIPRAGHFCWVDAPDKLKAEILRFIKLS